MLIDTHCHILPGLDDGADQTDDAIEMAREAQRQGIHTIVATPHHANGKYDNAAVDIDHAVDALNRELQLRGIAVNILAGQEVRVYPGLLNDLSAGLIRTLNGSRYLLIEFPSQSVPAYFQEMLFELQLMEITPVIAHPERNAVFLKQPRELGSLVSQGVLCQVTSQSLSGLFGKKIQRFAFDLCKEQVAHVIASDAHNMGSRPCTLARAYAYLNSSLGEKHVGHLVGNAGLLIRDETIRIFSTGRIKRDWLRFLRPHSSHF